MEAISVQPHGSMTSQQAEEWRRSLRRPGDGLDCFARPDSAEPLASRIERADRVSDCRQMTLATLNEWADRGAAISFWDGVWTKGICIDFLVMTWKGVFCVWSVDHRWTTRQAAMVEPARAQIQSELPGYPGRVEAVFHSPREQNLYDRKMMLHPDTDEPVEIVIMGGRIDLAIEAWQPLGGVGLDPEWMLWFTNASAPRWWLSDAGREPTPDIPHDERA